MLRSLVGSEMCIRDRHGLRCYGNITRMRNVSEYMLVLALCLVILCDYSHIADYFAEREACSCCCSTDDNNIVIYVSVVVAVVVLLSMLVCIVWWRTSVARRSATSFAMRSRQPTTVFSQSPMRNLRSVPTELYTRRYYSGYYNNAFGYPSRQPYPQYI